VRNLESKNAHNKIIMNAFQRASLLSAAVAVMVCSLTGCTTSRSKIANLHLKPQSDTVVEVMPFALAKKRFTGNDAWRRGLIGVAIDAGTGIYTYRFDDTDYSNLRKSAIESLRKANSFKDVRDVANENETRNGLRLYIDFAESGMRQAAMSCTCVLKAHAWTEDVSENVIAKKDILVEEVSIWTVSDAKNKAIDRFVQEVAALFSPN
jgi:hypothetical protein